MATIDLATITAGDGSQGFVLQGELAEDRSGFSVSSAGDVNGDGFDDLIVGAPRADGPADGRSYAGDSYVVFGKDSGFAAAIDLAAITAGDGSQGFVLQGELASDNSGYSVSSAGDVNGDGFDDLIVGASNADGPADGRSSAGDSYVVFGKDSGFAAAIDLAAITAGDGSQGFVLQGELAEDLSGFSVSSAGDVNGDGFDDLMVGALLADGPADGRSGAGDSYVVFGKAGGFAAAIDLAAITAGDGSQGFVLQGELAGDQSGRSVSSAGDVNGDGFDDLIVGARFADGPADGRSLAGDSYVVFGKAGGFAAAIDLAAITAGDGSQGFVLQGEQSVDYSGSSVSSAGDVNGDGFDDLIVGALYADGPADGRSGAGDSYVVFGKAGGFAATVDLAAITAGDGSQGFVLQGELAGDNSGSSVSSAGDVNGDGFDDLIVGARNADGPADGRASAGDSYVVFGKAGGFAAAIDLAAITAGDGSQGFVLQGELAGDQSGRSVSSAGDVNGDGFDDLMVGARYADGPADGRDRAGDTYVIFGAATIGGSASQLTQAAGGDGAQTLTGTAAIDILDGGRGDDTLVGGGGADSLRGGEGDDVLSIAGADFRRAAGGLGDDTLALAGPMTLADADFRRIDGIETIRLGNFATSLTLGAIAAGAIEGLAADGFRIAIDASLVTNAAITLDGSALTRPLTADFSGNAAAVDASGGAGEDLLKGGGGADILRGGSGDDDLKGGGGADRLFGGAGLDELEGDAGNDSYFVEGVDEITEAAGDANDRAFATASYTLTEGASIEIMSTANHVGTAAIDLTGDTAGNLIYGNAGANRLDGLGGADTLVGFGGDDEFVVDSQSDRVVETAGAGPFNGGIDHVFASVSYALRAGTAVERLSTADAAASDAINLTGNEFANLITGNAGANTLNGGGGADTLTGLSGNDFYFVDNVGDTIVEAVGDAGDRAFASDDYVLGAGVSVEILSTTNHGGLGAIYLSGNELANRVAGNTGANVLNGGAGKDLLAGFGGSDTFVFDTALNTAPAANYSALAATANVDRVTDFDVANDLIALGLAIFSAIDGTDSTLNPGEFTTGAAASAPGHRIVYNSATGQLIYDADGDATAAAVFQFALLAPGLGLGADDFVLVV